MSALFETTADGHIYYRKGSGSLLHLPVVGYNPSPPSSSLMRHMVEHSKHYAEPGCCHFETGHAGYNRRSVAGTAALDQNLENPEHREVAEDTGYRG